MEKTANFYFFACERTPTLLRFYLPMHNQLHTYTFLDFCVLLQALNDTKSAKMKVQLLSSALVACKTLNEACLMTQFIGEGVFASTEKRRATIGPKLAAECCSALCDIDYELVFKACTQATGSGSEAIALLLTNMTRLSSEYTLNPNLSEVVEMAEQLSRIKKKPEKEALVAKWMGSLNPICTRYLIRIFSQHSLRIGFELRSVLQAIALATEHDIEAIRYAHLITGSLAKTTKLAFENRLDEAKFKPFHPMAFMLASPSSIEDFPLNEKSYVVEEKLDGMRAQLHIGPSKVAIYSRDMNDVSDSFPELMVDFAQKMMPTTVLDGEIVVFKDEVIQPFRFLQKRMGVKKPTKKLLADYPVKFIAYDLLFNNEATLIEWPLLKRRKQLEALCSSYAIAFTKQHEIDYSVRDGNKQHIKAHVRHLFNNAIKHGNEGLVLKAIDSVYEYGQRKKSWLKLKEAIGNLDTVIMYAHAGSGKRGGLYSDFTLGISVMNDARFSEDFIPIGKAYGGFTDAELKRLNVELKKRIIQRFGPTLSVKAEIVVELAFEQIMLNKRTKAGFTLRLPRFKAIRWDKDASQINTLQDVEQMYNEDDGLRTKDSTTEQGVCF